MKKKLKVSLIICLSAFLATLILTPMTNASLPQTSAKDQLIPAIDSALDNYLSSHQVTIKDTFPMFEFQCFLASNPTYVEKVGKYLNLTYEENIAKFQHAVPDIAGQSVVSEGPIYKTFTKTINGTDVQANLRKQTLSNGAEVTKITFCTNGIDPNVYIERVQNTLPYWGFDLPCGYTDYIGVYIAPGTETTRWISQVNSWADNNNKINMVENGVFNLLLGIELPANIAIKIGTMVLGWTEGWYMFNGFSNVRSAMTAENNNSPEWGLNFGIGNTYQFYPDENGNLITHGFQDWYVRDWGQENYPFVKVNGLTANWGDIFLKGDVANAICIDNVVNTFGTTYSWNEWHQIAYDQMPKVLDPAAPVPITVIAVDQYGYSLGAFDEVCIDGCYAGMTGNTFFVEPNSAHSISVEGYGTLNGPSDYMWYDGVYGYGYFYTGLAYNYYDYLDSTDANSPSYFDTAENAMVIIVHYYVYDSGVHWIWTE